MVLEKDSIGGTSFRLTDLQPDLNYTYTIQAISDSYRNSEWTESEIFRADHDAISEITESAERVRIYDMRGKLVGECFADELHRFSLRHGIYLVRQMDGKIRKVVLR